ncbi:type II secretion system GspH family protein [Pseudoalteromonas sp. CnMc7-15]|uniref:type II secretion system protein n=1 Tax=unclassified Pseudoalteromonas TaxID=194690 RepID=UPI001EF69163|nr:type II secretion system protein [Pseudoalteromonas sp. CnMc7-15]MCG7566520.1 type II secretion system GspH family protein [Pseudoalteromonas sp. CnMc7-15]
MYRSKVVGFSLIELMVVMAIMAVVMGLTGGLVSKSIDQQERLVEVEKVRQIFRRLGQKAYFSGQQASVRLQENSMRISGPVQEDIRFEHLTFVANDYVVNTNTHVQPQQFGVIQGEHIKRYNLLSLFEPYNDNK